jgi:hypothetical protein
MADVANRSYYRGSFGKYLSNIKKYVMYTFGRLPSIADDIGVRVDRKRLVSLPITHIFLKRG